MNGVDAALALFFGSAFMAALIIAAISLGIILFTFLCDILEERVKKAQEKITLRRLKYLEYGLHESVDYVGPSSMLLKRISILTWMRLRLYGPGAYGVQK